nr:hypothetical protein [Bacteroides intestinalis]
MDILKDASSTAIYGSKGSAGVILILLILREVLLKSLLLM